jgi:hypothetical protein
VSNIIYAYIFSYFFSKPHPFTESLTSAKKKKTWTVTNCNMSWWPEERAAVLFIYLWFTGVTPGGNSAASLISSYIRFRITDISPFSPIRCQFYMLLKWFVETDVQTPPPTNITPQ